MPACRVCRGPSATLVMNVELCRRCASLAKVEARDQWPDGSAVLLSWGRVSIIVWNSDDGVGTAGAIADSVAQLAAAR